MPPVFLAVVGRYRMAFDVVILFPDPPQFVGNPIDFCSDWDETLDDRRRKAVQDRNKWPDIPFLPWADTCNAFHLYTQIVGKYRLAHTPWINHGWHATLYVDADGLSTGLIPDASGITIRFDLHAQRLVGINVARGERSFPLESMTVAEFDQRFKSLVRELGGTPEYHGVPNELPKVIPFAEDKERRPWDTDAVVRFHQALVQIDAVFKKFRTGFLGKVSPVHLFWGSFDLAVTRFSGRDAPSHPGGIPNLPDDVTREAYSHEVSSAGFWPGGGGINEPCFYSYAYPAPDGIETSKVSPAEAQWNSQLGEFVLSYASVRNSGDPEATLLQFLQSTYVAAADRGDWPRAALECIVGEPGKPRQIG